MVLAPFRRTRDLREIIKRLEGKVAKLEEEKKVLSETLNKERRRLEEETKKQRLEYERIVEELEEKIDRYENNLEKCKRLIEWYEKSLKEYESRIASLEDGLRRRENELERRLRKERVLKQELISSKRSARKLKERLERERVEEKELSTSLENIIRKIFMKLVEKEFDNPIREFIDEIIEGSELYEISLKSKRGAIYHPDLDGSIAASLIAQYLLERYHDFPKIFGSFYRNLKENIQRFCKENDLEDLFLLDLLPIEYEKIIPLTQGLKRLTIITDKERNSYNTERIEVIGASDNNKSTSELTYDYLKKKGFKGNNAERLVELAIMSHGKQPDEEAKTIQYSLELIPQLSEPLIFELAEHGKINDERVWRLMDCCFSVASQAVRLISRSYETLYEGESGVLIHSPISFFYGLNLSDIRREKGKNAIGIKFDGDEIIVIGRCKNKEDAETLEKYLQKITPRINIVHQDYIIANCPRDSERELILNLKEYCMREK
ncbi:MAG: hypothetical protein KQA36_02315 [Candidatus Aenigmarchaeota archaeon]|nr:hypothetical protein [Candidatus Aenigmarchaeota archaeon]